MRKSLILLSLILPLAVWAGEGAATITADEIKEHVAFLASDELSGRGTGTEGERAAAEYLSTRFRAYGLEPGSADGTFLQGFSLQGGAQVKGKPTLEIAFGRWARGFTAGADFVPFGFSASGEQEVPIVFAGYGVTDPERNYDDYAGIDVRGKAVLILRHEPRSKDGAGRHSYFVTKAENAKKHGAVALLVANDPINHPDNDGLVPFQGAGSQDDMGISAAHVRRELIQSLFHMQDRDIATVQGEIDRALKPNSFSLEATLKFSVDIERREINANNVVAKLVGSDPKLKDEVLVIGAHYDHLGDGHQGGSLGGEEASGHIHNGADDNASGTAGLLELAQAFSQHRPRRTIYFVAFSGEELGLLGSQHFVENSPIAKEKIVAMINMDMIGRLRNDKVEVGGVGTSPNFTEMVSQVATELGLKTTLSQSGFGPSDHASFYGAGIPVLFFFTGMHEEYHRPADDVQLINSDGASKVSRAAYECAEEIANATERPKYVEVRRRSRARMGIFPDMEFEGPGVRISRVPEGPSQKAGVQPGDLVIKIGDEEIGTMPDLMKVLGSHKPGDKVAVVLMRKGEELTVTIELGGGQH